MAWRFSGYVRVFLGDPDLAIDHLERAIRLSPLDPLIFIVQNGIVLAHFFAARYEEALSWAQRTLRQNPYYVAAIIMAAVSAALVGRDDEVRKTVGRLHQIDPISGISISPTCGRCAVPRIWPHLISVSASLVFLSDRTLTAAAGAEQS